MAESNSELLSLKNMRHLELNRLSELQDEYNKVSCKEVLMDKENSQELLNHKKIFGIMSELTLANRVPPKHIPPTKQLLLSSVRKMLYIEIKNLEVSKSDLLKRKEQLVSSRNKLSLQLEEEHRLFNLVKQKCISQGINIQNFDESCSDLSEQSKCNSNEDPVNELKEKVLNLKELSKIRNSQILNFLNTYFPAPTEDKLDETTRNDIFGVNNGEPVKSLERIINSLLASHLHNAQNPWIVIDSTCWIPHVEFLIRCGIAVRNDENPSLLKLENFDT